MAMAAPDKASAPTLDRAVVERRIRATIYGNCIGDAIGLLTEFMNSKAANIHYKRPLEYKKKIKGGHQSRWAVGDWTDDSDQMFLIMRSLREHNGEANPVDFASKLVSWMRHGYPEFNDIGGMGIGRTTMAVLVKEDFKTNPSEAARKVWEETKRHAAPNGGVMRTSVVGTCHYDDLQKVSDIAIAFCTTTHYDPRCRASAVAVSVAISVMIQGETDIAKVIDKAYEYSSRCLETDEEKQKLWEYLDCDDLSVLELDDPTSIGYTYKCLGAGFWGLKQTNFRNALEEICMSGGDTDTNGAVAGALLACRLGDVKLLPKSWVKNLCYRDWLENELKQYLNTVVFPGSSEESQPENKRKLLCI